MTVAVAFIEALQTLPLLTPQQQAELSALQRQFPDVKALGQELIRRGWLTTFQANLVAKGKGHELVLDQYILLDLLGQGGMGQVFKARQQRMDRLVALKVIKREALKAPGAVERFLREVRVAAQLSHPNVVTVFDSQQVSGLHFLVMELMEGTDLAQLLKSQNTLPVDQACEYIRQAALGLQHAHEKGLVHRDIKPHNLMLTKQGVVKVMDMGLARNVSADKAASEGLTATGAVMGTADYMAPEQGMNAKRVDIRADIYSLGCSLYQLLAGKVPFPGETLTEKLIAHQLHDPEPVEKLRKGLPKGLPKVVSKMMAKKPEKRYQTPVEAASALQPFASAPQSASASLTQPVSCHAPRNLSAAAETVDASLAHAPAQRTNLAVGAETRTARKRRPIKMLAGLAVLILLVAGVLLFSGTSRSPDTRQQAGGIGATERTAPAEPARPTLPLTKPESRPDARPIQTVPSEPLILDLGNGVKLELVRIKAGSFLMGSPDSDTDAFTIEKPQHEVTISKDFYLGKFPVTQKQYARIMDKNPSFFCKDGMGANQVAGMNTDQFPVETVFWNEAKKFCEKLSKLTKRSVELPTEAEWEYACRAGTTTRYYCGDTLTAKDANFRGTVFGAPTKVGEYPANPWGLYDMAGNVYQWCADEGLRTYTKDKCTNPRGTTGSARGLRGGSWFPNPRNCRSAYRGGNEASDRRNNFGFRVLVRLD